MHFFLVQPPAQEKYSGHTHQEVINTLYVYYIFYYSNSYYSFDIGSMFLFSFKLVSLLQAYSPAATEVSPTQEYTLEVDLSYIVHTTTHFTAPYCYNSTVLHCTELYKTVVK